MLERLAGDRISSDPPKFLICNLTPSTVGAVVAVAPINKLSFQLQQAAAAAGAHIAHDPGP